MRLTPEVADLDVTKPHARPPRWRPLDPLLVLPARRLLYVIDLAEPIVNCVPRDPTLQAQGIFHAIEQHVLADAQAHDDVREEEMILRRLAAGGDGSPRGRLDRLRRVAPRVGEDRLIHSIEGQGP